MANNMYSIVSYQAQVWQVDHGADYVDLVVPPDEESTDSFVSAVRTALDHVKGGYFQVVQVWRGKTKVFERYASSLLAGDEDADPDV